MTNGPQTTGDRLAPSNRSEPPNPAALIALCCGLASFVPWVIVVTLPVALVAGGAGLWASWRSGRRQGRTAALMGMGLSLAALVLHLALAGLASIVGLLAG